MKFISIFLATLLLVTVTSAHAQTNEQNEKFFQCHDYKKQDTMDTKRLLVNCMEFISSDYDTVEEFIEEEHPELKLNQ
jgi:hypothetical protein